ncbi:uncharacterized protein [Euwallacea similis]|uniref:uncharacterized protein n=1 Tax=Euwallacea similis TaxID=1736056 RepID=UPI0034509F45
MSFCINCQKNIIEMASENVQVFSPKQAILQRSASVAHISPPSLASLSLRDTKSFTGNINDIKAQYHRVIEKINGNDQEIRYCGGIETRDLYNNHTIIVKREDLLHKGKIYGINDIAYYWKKDFRMWLWKNTYEERKNKSVGDHFKSHLIKN